MASLVPRFNMNYKKFNFSVSSIEEIAEKIRENFKEFSESSDEKQGVSLKIVFADNSKKITLTFYQTGTGMIQGNESELFTKIESILKGQEAVSFNNPEEADETEDALYKEKDIIMGLDESGCCDVIGDLIMSLVILPKEKAELFKDIPKNVKKLKIKELSYYCELIKKHGIVYDYVKLTPAELTYSPFDKVRLMDRKYMELVSKHAGRLNLKWGICLDDYGIKDELKTYFKNKEKIGVKVLCETSMDEKITATKLASIVSRHIRLTETKDLSEKNILEHDGNKVEFGKGSNNDQTEIWLKTYRKQYPYSEFPDFVRKNWANVVRIEEEFPKMNREILFMCPGCTRNISKILCFLDKTNNCIKYYCSRCKEILDYNELKEMKLEGLLCDTNAFVSGIVSRDVESTNSIFDGTCVIKLHKIINEIDTIGWGQKRGAQSELQRLKECEQDGKISISIRDYEITHPWDADIKLYGSISKNNGWALMSGDFNVSDNSHSDGAFVFKIMTFDPTLSEKEF